MECILYLPVGICLLLFNLSLEGFQSFQTARFDFQTEFLYRKVSRIWGGGVNCQGRFWGSGKDHQVLKRKPASCVPLSSPQIKVFTFGKFLFALRYIGFQNANCFMRYVHKMNCIQFSWFWWVLTKVDAIWSSFQSRSRTFQSPWKVYSWPFPFSLHPHACSRAPTDLPEHSWLHAFFFALLLKGISQSVFALWVWLLPSGITF